MNAMSRRHPGAVSLYVGCVLLPVIWGMNPVTAGIALASGVALLLLLEPSAGRKSLLFYLPAALLCGIVNPLFNHHGKTALFFLNGNPVTREAILYGLVMGMMIAAVMIWFRCFSAMMDTDRLLTLTALLSPRLSVVVSMTLRAIPMLRRQAEKTREAQKGLGLIREENGLDRVQGALRVFDGLVTWGLENGIVTADSMAARGYGSGKRTRYRLYPWKKADTRTALFSLGILILTAASALAGWTRYIWYPEMISPGLTVRSAGTYLCYAALSWTASWIEIADRIRWKRLRREIPEKPDPGRGTEEHGWKC